MTENKHNCGTLRKYNAAYFFVNNNAALTLSRCQQFDLPFSSSAELQMLPHHILDLSHNDIIFLSYSALKMIYFLRTLMVVKLCYKQLTMFQWWHQCLGECVLNWFTAATWLWKAQINLFIQTLNIYFTVDFCKLSFSAKLFEHKPDMFYIFLQKKIGSRKCQCFGSLEKVGEFQGMRH